VIDWYNSSTNDLDLKNFPPRAGGFYAFQSVSNLVAALPHPIIYTYHQMELNCFETVILLAGSQMQTELNPDDLAGPFVAPVTVTNHTVTGKAAATPRDAFNAIYPASWREYSTNIFSEAMQAKRICITASLDSFYVLSESTKRADIGKTLLRVLQATWQRHALKFPTNAEVVNCYCYMSFNGASQVVCSHTGLLFHNHDQFVFIDKCGVAAPYARFDFKDKNDLLLWLHEEIKPTMNKGDLFVVSFNDKEMNDFEQIFSHLNK
jgi:hypothetical protein